MGQAKQRGTYEERKNQAIRKEEAKQQWLAKQKELQPKPLIKRKNQRNALAIATLLAAGYGVNNGK